MISSDTMLPNCFASKLPLGHTEPASSGGDIVNSNLNLTSSRIIEGNLLDNYNLQTYGQQTPSNNIPSGSQSRGTQSRANLPRNFESQKDHKRRDAAYEDSLSLHKPVLSSFRTDRDDKDDFNYSQTQHTKSQVTAQLTASQRTVQNSMQQSKFIDDGKDSISQSSAVLSERTINLKKEITKLDDEIM